MNIDLLFITLNITKNKDVSFLEIFLLPITLRKRIFFSLELFPQESYIYFGKTGTQHYLSLRPILVN